MIHLKTVITAIFVIGSSILGANVFSLHTQSDANAAINVNATRLDLAAGTNASVDAATRSARARRE